METNNLVDQTGIAVGDQVILTERSISNEEHLLTVKVIDVRWIMGKQTFVVETTDGKRKVVGPRQISRA
jgi:hypothetical protein